MFTKECSFSLVFCIHVCFYMHSSNTVKMYLLNRTDETQKRNSFDAAQWKRKLN